MLIEKLSKLQESVTQMCIFLALSHFCHIYKLFFAVSLYCFSLTEHSVI